MSKKTVDGYLAGKDQWAGELTKLREILKKTPLEETVKWGMPCYTYQGKNVVGMSGFKNHFGLWFFQGALLKDSDKVLMNAQDGKTQAMRQWRMTSAKDIKPARIKQYVKEAIALVDEGKEIKAERKKPIVVPALLKAALAKNKKTADAFKKLTPGLRREYADYIAEAKRDDTKARRVEKILPMIAAGKGLNDKYR